MDSRILIVDDLATNRILLRSRLASASYQVTARATGEAALHDLEAGGFALVLIEAGLPGMDGFELCRRLRAEAARRGSEGAMLLLLVPPGDSAAVREGFAAGADAVLGRPRSDQALLARIRSLLRRRSARAALATGAQTCQAAGLSEIGASAPSAGRAGSAPKPRIAIVSDLAAAAMKLRGLLAAEAPGDYTILGGQAALAGAHSAAGPDLYLIAQDGFAAPAGRAREGLPSPALALLSELHARAAARRAEICLLLPQGDCETEALALDLGAAEVMAGEQLRSEAGPRLGALLARKQLGDALAASVETGLRAVGVDALTGISDRRSGLARLSRLALASAAAGGPDPEALRRGRGPAPLAVIMLDLDRFKSINDRHGHAAGDAVLVEVASRLKSRLGAGDLLARIGGEEFLVGLPASPMAQARAIAEDLRRSVAQHPVPIPGAPQGVAVTLSLGLALAEAGADTAGVLRRADAALFEAKRAGRNRVACAPGPLPSPA